jgi:hypothetical protein
VDKIINLIWMAIGEADDYFHRLGGAGRYAGFEEFDPVLLVAIMLCEELSIVDIDQGSVRDHLPIEMWNKTDGLPEKVRRIVAGIQVPTNEEKIELFKEFIHYVNSRKTKFSGFWRWDGFLNKIRINGIACSLL